MPITVGTPRILVVDDNPAIHDDFRRILDAGPKQDDLDAMEAELFGDDSKRPPSERTAFEIDSAFQGEEAIERVRRSVEEGRRYSLAFMDVRMPPGLDGINTIAKLWELDPHIQCVICTAYSDHTWDDIIDCLGHSDGLLVLRKPFDPLEALQAAHALTQKWALGEKVRQTLADLESLVQERTRALEHTNRSLADEVEQRKRAEEDLRHVATHDALTGLPNRIVLNDRLSQALARAKRSGKTVGVMLLDLDHFKDVNDTYGHKVGDELLVEVARRLTKCARVSDTVTRMGGDEFVVVLEELHAPDEAAIVAKRILDAFIEPIRVSGHELHTTPSVGMALFPTDCLDPDSLLKAADLAMYRAKSAGRGTYRCYAEGMFSTSMEKLQIREQLGFAVERGELTLVYQPLMDVRNGEITSFEALLRWQHPELGQIAPMKFIPLAEQTGLIIPIGAWVIRTACHQLAEWQRAGATELSIAVNASARQLQDPLLAKTVLEALAAARVAPNRLEIEITESAAAEDPARASAVLRELSGHGVRIAIDDFGSGYSSMARLRQLPIDTLKIDRSLVKNIDKDPRDAAVVATIAAMGRALGLNVVAEGVETNEQLVALRNLDLRQYGTSSCDRAQGFLLSKPLPPAAAWTLLQSPRERSGVHSTHDLARASGG